MATLVRICLALLCAATGTWALSPVNDNRLTEKEITLEPRPAYTNAAAGAQGIPPITPPTRISGYFKLAHTFDASMFYFMFAARRNPTHAPLVIWMTGGPGCSSELAVLYENGPYSLKDGGLVETEFGWDATHNMIFVDQPIGTGFSYSTDDRDTVHNEHGVADDMLDFIYAILAAHPELADLPLYITGESYAGHYVPAVSHRIWLANKNQEGPPINFKGLAVGNGLTEPSIQFAAYGDFAMQNNLINSVTHGWMKFTYPVCKLANTWCESTGWDFICIIGLQLCMLTQFQPVLASSPNINVYDITKKCTGTLCYDFTAADAFLNSPATRKALGVPDIVQDWTACNMDVYQNMAGDWLSRWDKAMPEMMADGIRIMIYAGELDLICNYLGNRRWVDALEWEGADEWAAAEDADWVVAGRPAGRVRSVGTLSFVQVFQAGHMVPMDQPMNALAMLTTWTRNASMAKALAPDSAHELATLFNGMAAADPAKGLKLNNPADPSPAARAVAAAAAAASAESFKRSQMPGQGIGLEKGRAQVRVEEVGEGQASREAIKKMSFTQLVKELGNAIGQAKVKVDAAARRALGVNQPARSEY